MRFLKSLPLYLGLGVIAASLPVAAHAGNTASYKVELNKTEIVRLPGAAASIIVGNPKIADVTVQSSDLLFVVGRGYGETNLIILDINGNTMMNADLQVVNSLPTTSVRLYNGGNRETYSCIPYCGPSPVLGDNAAYIASNTTREQEIQSTSAFAAAPRAAAPSSTNQFDFDNQTAGSPLNAQTNERNPS